MDGRTVGRPAAGAVPAARAERRRHDLAAPHVDRALRRAARAGRRHAPGAPQLLHRRGLRRPLLDVPHRGAARARGLALPGVRPPRGHLRRRAVDGRVRRAEVGAAAAGAVRRRRQPVRRPSTSPRLRTGPGAPGGPELFERVFGDRTDRRHGQTTSSRCSSSADAGRLPPLYVCCGTEDGCSTTTSRSGDACAARPGAVDRRLRPRRPRLGLLGRADPGRARLAAAAQPRP